MTKSIVSSRYSSPKEAKEALRGLILLYKDAGEFGINFQPRNDAAFYTPEGKFVALFLADVFTLAEQDEREAAFAKVKQDLRNRPEVIGRNARQQLLRNDGTPTDFVGTPREVLGKGKSAVYGYYRYKNPQPGLVKCGLTGPTKDNLELYLRIVEIEKRITSIYKHVLPKQYAEQMKYIDSLLPKWKTEGSAFTTVYALKNHPCAVHVDKFDIPSATGVLTTTGMFTGNELCMPEYGIAFDVQPSDILFMDVHQLHGNFPRTGGDRTSQIYFVRRGMHECK